MTQHVISIFTFEEKKNKKGELILVKARNWDRWIIATMDDDDFEESIPIVDGEGVMYEAEKTDLWMYLPNV